MREKVYLGDGQHHFIIRPDKYSGEPLAELFNSNDECVSMRTVGGMTQRDLINLFEIRVEEG